MAAYKLGLFCICAILLGACASTKSMVISIRANTEKIEEGLVYSLPEQLVKVSYVRKAIDSTEAKTALKKTQESFEGTEKLLKEKKKSESELAELIKNIDPTAPNKSELEAKLNLDLTKIKAEKIVITKLLSEQNMAYENAKLEYAQSLQNDKAFSETLTITAEGPTPDFKNTFYAKVNHEALYSDTIDIKVKNGMLDGAIGQSDDKTGEIIVSLAGGIAGLFPSSFLGIAKQTVSVLRTKKLEKPECIKKSAVSVAQLIDPVNDDLSSLNSQLADGCIELKIDEPKTIQKKSLGGLNAANGLVYRQPGTFSFIVVDLDTNLELQKIRVSLAQGGQVGILTFPKGNFSKNEYDYAFSNGMLVKQKVIQPSELLGAVKILPNVIKEVFALPTELIKLKVDYSSSEGKLLELKKSMIDTQIEIDKKQMELEALISSKK